MAIPGTPRQDRLRGSPFEAQREEKTILGRVVQVYPETCSCKVKDDEGGIHDSLPFPGLIQGYPGSGAEVFVPQIEQRVELVTGGSSGTRIRGFAVVPLPAVVSESATPAIFPDNLPTNQRGRTNYRGALPKNLVSGDWCRLGSQGQHIGVFSGGMSTIFGSPWAQINAIGGTALDTVNLIARRLNVMTAFGELKAKSENGRHAIEFQGGLDQMTETGANQSKWTYRGGLGTSEGFSFFSVTSKTGDPIYRVNVGYDGSYNAFHSRNHSLRVQGDARLDTIGGYSRVVGGADFVEVQTGDRTEVFKRNRTCSININNSVTIMGSSSETVQNSRMVTCQTLDHNVSGKPTSLPGDTAYALRVANGSWDVDIGKPPTDFLKSKSSFNLAVWSPGGGINFETKLGAISMSSKLDTSIKALTTLDLTATGIATLNGALIKIGGPGANQVALKGTKVLSDLAQFLSQVNIAVQSAGAPTANATALKAIGVAATSLSAKLSAWASTKVFVS